MAVGKVHLILSAIAVAVVLIGFEIMLWMKYSGPVRIVAVRFHFYALIEIGVILLSRYIWKRVNHLFMNSPRPAVKMVVQLVLIVSLGLAISNFIVMNLWCSYEPHLLALFCSHSLSIAIFVFMGLVAVDASGFVLRLVFFSKLAPEARQKEKRVRTLLALLLGLVLVILGLVGVNNLQIEPITVPIKGLHPSLNGTTIAQISDIHLGPYIGRSRLKRIVDITNSLKADIVVITGDLADSSLEVMKKGVEPLKELKTKHGVYFCTGNHDYYTGDVDNWISYLPSINVKPLINDRVCLLTEHLETCENGLYMAGLEDIDTRRLQYGSHSMDLHRALSGRSKNVPTIVLAHQPYAAAEAIEWKGVNLVLSGHTHAGQVFPLMIPVYLYNPFFVGLYQPYKDVFVYVSPGVNYFTIPFRHYRPGITYITITSKE